MKQTCVKCKATFWHYRLIPLCDQCSPAPNFESAPQCWSDVENEQGWRMFTPRKYFQWPPRPDRRHFEQVPRNDERRA